MVLKDTPLQDMPVSWHTTFNCFATALGNDYGIKSCKSLSSSLLRILSRNFHHMYDTLTRIFMDNSEIILVFDIRQNYVIIFCFELIINTIMSNSGLVGITSCFPFFSIGMYLFQYIFIIVRHAVHTNHSIIAQSVNVFREKLKWSFDSAPSFTYYSLGMALREPLP